MVAPEASINLVLAPPPHNPQATVRLPKPQRRQHQVDCNILEQCAVAMFRISPARPGGGRATKSYVLMSCHCLWVFLCGTDEEDVVCTALFSPFLFSLPLFDSQKLSQVTIFLTHVNFHSGPAFVFAPVHIDKGSGSGGPSSQPTDTVYHTRVVRALTPSSGDCCMCVMARCPCGLAHANTTWQFLRRLHVCLGRGSSRVFRLAGRPSRTRLVVVARVLMLAS